MPDATEIRTFLALMSSGEESAQASAAYTGSPRVHHNIGAPALHDFVADYIASHKHELTPDVAVALLEELYAGESVEEPIIAGLLLAKLPKVRAALPLGVFGRWLDRLHGWVEVDSTCQSTFAPKDIYARWDEWAAFLRGLNASLNINQRRASLVLLIRTVRESDDPRGMALALELIDTLKGERDKLITKAVSWVLREAAKRHSAAVAAYLDAHAGELPAHVVREVRKKLETGKKT